MYVFTCKEFACGRLPESADALLLEGDWLAVDEQQHAGRWALDAECDVRQKWIDETAHKLAALAARDTRFLFASVDGGESPALNAADLFALKLRYEFVKWLRLIAFFGNHRPSGECRLYEPVSDYNTTSTKEYGLLLHAIAQRDAFPLRILPDQQEATPLQPETGSQTHESVARRDRRSYVERLCRLVTPRSGSRRARVMFSGNPRILDPICSEFSCRGHSTIWLRKQFAPRSWLKWRFRGGHQLVMPRPIQGKTQKFFSSVGDSAGAPSPYLIDGIDLAGCISSFLFRLVQSHGDSLWQEHEQLQETLHEHRPTCLILDEDATSGKRLTVNAAQKQGIPSFVIQHGAPRLQFGFAPLMADAILAWGDSSRAQLVRFGISPERIAITGRADWSRTRRSSQNASKKKAQANVKKRARRNIHVLLLATTWPRDDRPEPVAFHLTSRAHAELVNNVFAALSRFPGARLTIKRHPRCEHGDCFQRIVEHFPRVRTRVIKRGTAVDLARQADVTLNLASGSGIEAAADGAKVIELVPAGGQELLPAEAWGGIGSATTVDQLSQLLAQILDQRDWKGVSVRAFESIFAATGNDAARKAVNEILARQQHEFGSARVEILGADCSSPIQNATKSNLGQEVA
ncbi:MAG: hypothetical protein MPJ50_11050 [Pirellulales bacterium]|nr:hypothetical protein [Pirellulales bacterium]